MALKEDLSATAAEMVYGTTLRLPGEFFQPLDSQSVIDPTDYVSQLKSHMQSVRPTYLAYLMHWLQLHVFVRNDAV